jgi:hypothetical protein
VAIWNAVSLMIFLRFGGPNREASPTGRVMAVYALTAAAVRPLIVGIVARFGQRSSQVVQNWMTAASNIVSARYSMVKSQQVATKLLAEVGGREAATLAYANSIAG